MAGLVGKWANFTDEELLLLHLGMINLPKETQMQCLTSDGPFYELRRRHDKGVAWPDWFFELLEQYPVLHDYLNEWHRKNLERRGYKPRETGGR